MREEKGKASHDLEPGGEQKRKVVGIMTLKKRTIEYPLSGLLLEKK